jgi:hypothetical protein
VRSHQLLVWFVAFGLCSVIPRTVMAADAEAPTPPRLSLVDGAVSFSRPGAPDWVPARVNTPLAAGDALYVPGQASLDLRELPVSHTVEVDTPNAAFTIEHAGYYRVDVEPDATTFITRRGGTATAATASGAGTAVSASEELVVSGVDAPTLQAYAAPDLDGWDRWSTSRTDQLLDAMSFRYVPTGVYGAAGLDENGTWWIVPEYGAVWIPESVSPGWAPYTAGDWIYDPFFSWTWVDDASWGWAPFHYGRWVFVDGFWGWAPGPIVLPPAYASRPHRRA